MRIERRHRQSDFNPLRTFDNNLAPRDSAHRAPDIAPGPARCRPAGTTVQDQVGFTLFDSFGQCRLLDDVGATSLDDEVLDFVVDEQQLEDARSTYVSGVETRFAAGSLVKLDVAFSEAAQFCFHRFDVAWLMWLLAVRADHAQKSLGHHTYHRRRDQVGFDAHIDQPRNRGGRVVGVERAENKVTRQGEFYRDIRGFFIMNLPVYFQN